MNIPRFIGIIFITTFSWSYAEAAPGSRMSAVHGMPCREYIILIDRTGSVNHCWENLPDICISLLRILDSSCKFSIYGFDTSVYCIYARSPAKLWEFIMASHVLSGLEPPLGQNTDLYAVSEFLLHHHRRNNYRPIAAILISDMIHDVKIHKYSPEKISRLQNEFPQVCNENIYFIEINVKNLCYSEIPISIAINNKNGADKRFSLSDTVIFEQFFKNRVLFKPNASDKEEHVREVQSYLRASMTSKYVVDDPIRKPIKLTLIGIIVIMAAVIYFVSIIIRTILFEIN